MRLWHVTMTHIYFSDLIKKKSQSGNRTPVIISHKTHFVDFIFHVILFSFLFMGYFLCIQVTAAQDMKMFPYLQHLVLDYNILECSVHFR